MDFNSSMQKYIHSLKDQIVDIIMDIKNTNPNCVMYVALSGYAGIADSPRARYLPFTKDLNHLKNVMKKNSTSDSYTCSCRNVVEGYATANNIDWIVKRKIIFHLGNAPSYGKNYHDNNVYDKFPSGHPYWTLEDEIQCIASKEIDIVILKISKTTTIMEKLLEQNYHQQRTHGFHVVDLTGHLNNLDAAVYDAVKTHLLRLLAQ